MIDPKTTKLFDMENPDNNLGPVVVALIITLVVGIIASMFGLAHHGH